MKINDVGEDETWVFSYSKSNREWNNTGTENIFTAETVLWGFLVQRECELCASAMFLIMLRPLRLTGPTPVLHRGDTKY
eukprot:scaffold797_cov408-Chaetoceros_neogracile.AAC.8